MTAGTETGVKHLVLRYAPLKKMGAESVLTPGRTGRDLPAETARWFHDGPLSSRPSAHRDGA